MRPNIAQTIWGLKEYGVYVPMTDAFYQSLVFNKTDRENFLAGTYEPQPDYDDSRKYLRPILKNLIFAAGDPLILDVGAYIGRFSIEASLLCRELDLPASSIVCFEPGDTIDLLHKNLDLNDSAHDVRCVNAAVTNVRGRVRFAIKDDALISSRVLSEDATTADLWGNGWSETAVASVTIADYIDRPARPFVCKIDTEGHEAQVIEGIGAENLEHSPHAIIIEYWPSLLDQTILGIPFDSYIFENYVVFDIRSALYPAHYVRLADFEEITRRIHSREVDNLDLLLLRREMPNSDRMIAQIGQLGQLKS
jgi:FkbM family methyltransferase